MKKAAMLAALLCVLLALCACGRGGAKEWTYALPNGYAIHSVDGKVRCDENGEQALSEGITAFCIGERYVGIRQSVDDHPECWFLLDTKNKVFYSAADETEFNGICESFGCTDLGNWIRTDTMPEGAEG